MSKKSDIIVVGVLSAALFTGFTAYSYSADKVKAKAQAKAAVVVTAVVPDNSKSSAVQTPADTKPDVAQPGPDSTVTKKKTTKSKAS